MQPSSGLRFAPAQVTVDDRPDGVRILRSPVGLGPYERHLGEMLRRQAALRPEDTFLAERRDEAWHRVSWRAALSAAESVGQALVDRGLGTEQPVMVLSGNSVNQALLMLGAHLAGVPIAPVSPAYSLMSQDFGKLRHTADQLQPPMLFVESRVPFEAAIESLGLDAEVVVGNAGPGEGTPFSELLAVEPGDGLRQAEARVGPDTVAKVLFTSGSTGMPKGVLNTHRMLCSNQQMISQVWPFLGDRQPVLVDWLPWNHTFGANHNFYLVLKHGGTLYIDAGKPRPDAIDETVRNLKEVAPTLYFNVPAGFAQLLPHLENDRELRENFFRQLDLIFYAGAALPQDLWQRLEALSLDVLGRKVVMTSAWGSTETSPLSTSVHFPIERAGVIGLPTPGVEIKMVPSGSKMELRVRGPHVTPGYLTSGFQSDTQLTEAAFDDEGFYRIGDAGRLEDPEKPEKGLVFDGRVAENFKLQSGTWVHVGELRVAALAATAPVLLDAVVTGHDRSAIGLLAWINEAACRRLPGVEEDLPMSDLLCHSAIVDRIRRGLAGHNGEAGGSSRRISRVLLLTDPPSLDRGEITDKGYINQHAALEHRRKAVETLYADSPDSAVIEIGNPAD